MRTENVYRVYKLIKLTYREGYRACFVRAFAEKEKAIDYVKGRKTIFIVSRDGKIIYKNHRL